MQKANQVLNTYEQQPVKAEPAAEAPNPTAPKGLGKAKALYAGTKLAAQKKIEAFNQNTCIKKREEKMAEDAVALEAANYAKSDDGKAEAAAKAAQAAKATEVAEAEAAEEATRVEAEKEVIRQLQEDLTVKTKVVEEAAQGATLRMVAVKEEASKKLAQAQWAAKFKKFAAQGTAQARKQAVTDANAAVDGDVELDATTATSSRVEKALKDKDKIYAQIEAMQVLEKDAAEKNKAVVDAGQEATLSEVAAKETASNKLAQEVQKADLEKVVAQAKKAGEQVVSVIRKGAGKAAGKTVEGARWLYKNRKASKWWGTFKKCLENWPADMKPYTLKQYEEEEKMEEEEDKKQMAQESPAATAEAKAQLEAEDAAEAKA